MPRGDDATNLRRIDLAPFDQGASFFGGREGAMTMKSDDLCCRYCGEDVDPDDNHGKDSSTGRYFHIECFIEREPRGREIAERAGEVAQQFLDEQEGKRAAH
jgi:hypothetical protein